MENKENAVLFSENLHAVLPDDTKNSGGHKYLLNASKDRFQFSYKESFFTETIANQFGLLGMALKKFFDAKWGKEESFIIDLSLVKKIVLNKKTVMGRKIQFLHFTGDNYSNLLNLTVNDEQLANLKTYLADLFKRVDYEENNL